MRLPAALRRPRRTTSYVLFVNEPDVAMQRALQKTVEGRKVLGRPIVVMFDGDPLTKLGSEFRRLEEEHR